ncbi:hypothetical protein SRHO_G00317940 [Serrasalmus rhombeus]
MGSPDLRLFVKCSLEKQDEGITRIPCHEGEVSGPCEGGRGGGRGWNVGMVPGSGVTTSLALALAGTFNSALIPQRLISSHAAIILPETSNTKKAVCTSA